MANDSGIRPDPDDGYGPFTVDRSGTIRENGTAIGAIYPGMAEDYDRIHAIDRRLTGEHHA